MSTIRIKEMLAVMETGQPFSLTFVTYDRKRKKGGEIRTYDEAVLCQSTTTTTSKNNRPMTRMEQMEAFLHEEPIKRNPNHQQHYTRNIQLLQQGHPTAIRKKIHPLLVTKFNEMTVTT